MSHFAICSKLQHTFHYIYLNFNTPTPCLTLYSTAHLTKQTLATLNFQLGLSKSHFVFQRTLQEDPIVIKPQLSSKMSNCDFPADFKTHLLLILNFEWRTLQSAATFSTHLITKTEILTVLRHALLCIAQPS